MLNREAFLAWYCDKKIDEKEDEMGFGEYARGQAESD